MQPSVVKDMVKYLQTGHLEIIQVGPEKSARPGTPVTCRRAAMGTREQRLAEADTGQQPPGARGVCGPGWHLDLGPVALI